MKKEVGLYLAAGALMAGCSSEKPEPPVELLPSVQETSRADQEENCNFTEEEIRLFQEPLLEMESQHNRQEIDDVTYYDLGIIEDQEVSDSIFLGVSFMLPEEKPHRVSFISKKDEQEMIIVLATGSHSKNEEVYIDAVAGDTFARNYLGIEPVKKEEAIEIFQSQLASRTEIAANIDCPDVLPPVLVSRTFLEGLDDNSFSTSQSFGYTSSI